MISTRTEKAIKAVIAAKGDLLGRVDIRKNGNHAVVFYNSDGIGVATFTLQSIIGKRLKKRAKK